MMMMMMMEIGKAPTLRLKELNKHMMTIMTTTTATAIIIKEISDVNISFSTSSQHSRRALSDVNMRCTAS